MKVIKNRYNNCNDEERIIFCDECNSELEIRKEDVKYDDKLGYVTCPCCGNDIYLEDYDYVCTYNNVNYPDFFISFKDGKSISDKEINQYIKEGIEKLRKNKWPFWYVMLGNLFLIIINNEDEKEYDVIVSQDYKENYLTYTNED